VSARPRNKPNIVRKKVQKSKRQP